MKNNLFLWVFLSCSFLGYAQIQEETVLLTQRNLPNATVQKTTTVTDTIAIPIFDDFSGDSPFPEEKFWADKKVYINKTMALNPMSVGVATFDGLDQYGFPYDINRPLSDTLADVLTSNYIDLSGENNVFLSFYFQGGGMSESPVQDDSLVIEFLAPTDTAWNQVWSTKGFFSSTFKPAIVKVVDAKYYVKGFKFRIAAYGAKNGLFDIWNLDYLKMEANGSLADTLIQDPTFVYAMPSFLKGYQSIPWFHYKPSVYKDTLKTVVRKNGSDPMSISLNQFRIYKDGSQTFSNPGFFPGSLPYNQDFSNPLQVGLYNPAPITGETNLTAEAFLPGTSFGTYLKNDTLRGTTVLKNYYALDDGTAERGYGIKNAFGARVAFRLDPLEPDTLKGMYFRFAHAGVDATQYTFKIGVWQNNNGEPGNPIYLSDSNYTPDYGYYHNSFIPYVLDTNLYITGSVFVGFRKNTDQPIHVGLDVIDTNSARLEEKMDLWYGSQFTWYPSLTKANAMMRPFFKYTPIDLSVQTQSNHWKPVLYPNPVNSILYLNTNQEVQYTLVNLMGQQVMVGTAIDQIDVSEIKPGLYIISVVNQNGKTYTQKLLKN